MLGDRLGEADGEKLLTMLGEGEGEMEGEILGLLDGDKLADGD